MKRLTKICLVLLCGSMMMQSFECASPEMATAKQKYSAKDYNAAKTSLERELAKNPANGEAWFLLARTNKELRDFPGMIRALEEADKNVKDEKLRQQMAVDRYSAWIDLYNTSIESYNTYSDSQGSNTEELGKAISNIQLAAQIKPDIQENYSLLARYHEAQKDTAKAVEAYNRYIRLQQPAVNFAREKGLYMNMPLSAAKDILGQVKSRRANAAAKAGDSTLVEMYAMGDNSIYVFSTGNNTGYKVVGWRVNPPPAWMQMEKERFSTMDVDPYVALTNLYIEDKNFDQALANLDNVLVLDPVNEAAMQQKIQLYQDLNRTEEAVKMAEDLTRKNPKNKLSQLQYANIMFRLNRNDEAIAGYERALEIDPKYDNALFYAGAAYKNRAQKIQQEEKAKLDKDPKYKVNDNRYLPDLRKAAEYFMRYSELPQKQSDFRPLQELINIYEVTQEKDKTKTLMGQLEALESFHGSNADYWNALGRLYTRQNLTEKAKAAYAKADELAK